MLPGEMTEEATITLTFQFPEDEELQTILLQVADELEARDIDLTRVANLSCSSHMAKDWSETTIVQVTYFTNGDTASP